MKKGGISGSILLILALQLALLLAGTQSLLADDLPAIRLPSDVKGEGNHAAGEGSDKQKPWGDCCDNAMCNYRLPPGCTCMDKVESCSSACKDCEEVSSDPPRYVCRDMYDFDLEDWLKNKIPKCT